MLYMNGFYHIGTSSKIVLDCEIVKVSLSWKDGYS